MKEKIEQVIFFNHFHKGDLHVSRGLIQGMIEKLQDYNFSWNYGHQYDADLLADLPIVNVSIPTAIKDHYWKSYRHKEILYLNTWYGSDNGKYLKQHGLTFDCLFHLFNDHLKEHFGLEFDVNDAFDYFPEISFLHPKIQSQYVNRVSCFLDKCSGPVVLICNEQPMSGQGCSVNLDSIVLNLAQKYQGLIFVLTTKTTKSPKHHNIFYTSDIIGKKEGSDLNKISLLSQSADFIIGKASGPFTYCLTQTNVMRNDLNMISFSNIEFPSNQFWLGSTFGNAIKYSANIRQVNTNNNSEAQNLLDQEIRKRYVK